MGERHPLGEVCRVLGIPEEVIESYLKMGISTLYDWQVQCLLRTNVLSNGNLVYCAPTGGGKTLIAEFAILKTVLVSRKKAIFVLPFVSLVLEKEKYFKKFLLQINKSRGKNNKIRVKGYYGDINVMCSEKEDILICTIEKANGLVNNFIMRGQADRIGCIVMDEMHALGALFNGYLLEILISKVLYLEQRVSQFIASTLRQNQSILDPKKLSVMNSPASSPVRIQLIAMSATVGNVAEIARWFGNDEPFITAFRPVALFEKLVAGTECCNRKGQTMVASLPLSSKGSRYE
jgi:DNA polymerase theta